MAQEQPRYLSTDPNAGQQTEGRYLSTDPGAGQAENPEEQGIFPYTGFFNRGLSETVTLGAGADWMQEGMRRLGIVVPEREPETLGERASLGAGHALGVVPGMSYGLANLAASGPSRIAGFSRQLLSPYLRAPVSAIATETAAGAGSGAASEYGPAAEMAGGLAGGLGVGAYMSARRGLFDAATTAVGRARQRATEALFPFTESGARLQAGTQLQGRVPDPAAVAGRVGRPSVGGLSPAQQTGDANLIALERTIRTRSPQAEADYLAQLDRSEQALRSAAEEIGGGGLEARIQGAMDRAQQRIRSLTPERQMEDASSVYQEELLRALSEARALESVLWDIPNIRISTATLRGRYRDLASDLPAAQADDMPAVARRLLGRRSTPDTSDALIVGPNGETLVFADGAADSASFRASENVRELHGFYSQMREEARNFRASGRSNAARIADELADAAWQDLVGAADAPTAVSENLQAAREYSRVLNQTFRQGEVGRVLGYARTGERRMAGDAVLERTLGSRGGAQAAITSEELTEAAGFGGRDSSRAMSAIEDYLKRRLLLAAQTDTGSFNATAARSFLRRNRALLSRHPRLHKEMQRAVTAMESSDRVSRARRTVSQAMSSSSPEQGIQEAMRGLPTEDAGAIRTGLLQYGLYVGNRLDDQGNPVISGARLAGMLRNPSARAGFARAYTPEELSRLELIAAELESVQLAAGNAPSTIAGTERLESQGTTVTGRAITYVVGTVGARLGAVAGGRTSGASLRTASRAARLAESGASDFMHRHADRLLQDAATNPRLYQALLTPLDAPEAGSDFAMRTILAWVRRTAIEIGEDAAIPTAVGIGAVGGVGLRDNNAPARQGGPGPVQ